MNFLSKTSTVAIIGIVILVVVGYTAYKLFSEKPTKAIADKDGKAAKEN